MKDPESKWKMEEYSSSSKENDDEDEVAAAAAAAGSIVKWMLKNGYVIGRRIIVTGIMISSAPLLVPPLVAFSAMGVVFSVPFGFLFGTYACTNNLITILLPDPDPVLMLDYYAAHDDCRQLDAAAAVEDGYGPEVKGYYADREDKELMEGTSHRVEIELDDYKQATLIAPNYVDDNVDGIREMEDVMQVESLDINAGDDYVEEEVKEKEPLVEDEKGSISQEAYVVSENASVCELDRENKEREHMEDIMQGVDDMRLIRGDAGEYLHEDDEQKTGEQPRDDAGEYLHEDDEQGTQEQTRDDEQRTGEQARDDAGEYHEQRTGEQARDDAGEYHEQGTEEQVRDDAGEYYVQGTGEQVRDDAGKYLDEDGEQGGGEHTHVDAGEYLHENDEQGTGEQTRDDAGEYEQGTGEQKQTLVENENKYKPEVNEDVKSKDEGIVTEDDYFVRESSSFGDVKDVETTEPVMVEEKDIEHAEDIKQRVEMIASDDQGYEEDDDNSLEEEQKGEEPLVNEDARLKDKEGIDETTKHVTVKEIDSQKLVQVGSKSDELVGAMRHVVILSQGNDENNYNSRQVEELDLVAREVTNKDKRNIESDEKVVRQSMGTVEINGGNASKEETLNHSNPDSLEVGDDERKTNINLGSLEVGNVEKEDTSDRNVDVLARSPLKQAPLDTANAKDTSKAYKKMHSKEDDERMWEKIRAMRKIVGYKAPSEATCIGELKALYVFTGVEPPASSEDDSDLEDKLNFLMAIIGVK